MPHLVGPKGQVVIPKDLRDQFSIEPGDLVTFWRCDDYVAVKPVRDVTSLRGLCRGLPLLQHLEASRRRDRVREQAR